MFAEMPNLMSQAHDSLLIIVMGLAIVFFNEAVKHKLPKLVFYWIGLIVAVIGAILFAIRPLAYGVKHLSDATGVG